MTGAERDRKALLRERLANARRELLDAVAALSDADLAKPAGHASDWTAKDLLGHVAYAEGSMLPMIQGPLAGTPRQLPPDFDLDRWNAGRVRRAREQSVADLLARLDESRRVALELLDGMSDTDLDRQTSHPLAPHTTVAGIYTVIADHELGHARELRAVRGATPASAK